jgi:hypothetical protein
LLPLHAVVGNTAVAQHLGVDRRTVHRKRLGEGTSFSALLEAERRALSA